MSCGQQQCSCGGNHQQQQQQQQPSCGGGNGQSQIEQQVISATQPIHTNEHEQISAAGYHGIYLNKQEAQSQYRGQVPLEQVQINQDPNPEVIRKRMDKVKYRQEVSVKYLNPPPAPKPGDIIIREKTSSSEQAPPIVLRQEGQGSCTPPPLVYREYPPQPPQPIPEQYVEIETCNNSVPTRRVVVEKLGNLPPKPQNILIEKWLPYKSQKRRVRYEPACQQGGSSQRNVVIEWEAPEVEVEQVCVNLGVEDACPEEYIRQHGCELKQPCEMPQLCQCQQQQQSCGGDSNLPELEGDIDALRCVDLDKYCLGEYRRFL